MPTNILEKKEITLEEACKDINAIKTINRVFHDWDADSYENEHPEIYMMERASWEELLEGKLAMIMSDPDLVLLDIGTGNGFVIETIAPFIAPSQKVIFSDISQKMIDSVQKKFSAHPFKKEFLVSEAAQIPLPDASVGLIVVNSVLHHIPDYEVFLNEAKRLIRPGGALVIKHEPNVRYGQNFFLRSLYALLYSLSGRKKAATPRPLASELVDALAAEGITFSEPVNQAQLQSLIDIGSPTAGGGLDMERGFDPYLISSKHFPSANLVEIRSYAFLGKFNENKNSLTKLIARVLKTIFPKDGGLFDLVIIT